MKLSRLILDAKNDIPFLAATATLHQPTIREIALMGEEAFFNASHLLTFSKDKFLSEEDKIRLENTSNFDIFMQVMNDKTTDELQETKFNVIMLLQILFPHYIIQIENNKIALMAIDENDSNGEINNDNFEEFKEIITAVFCIKPLQGETYNPKGKLARKIAEKLEAGRKKAAEAKGEKNINIFQHYISILAVGMAKDKNTLYEYSLYQLYDEFERYQLKVAYDAYMQALVAGAKMDNEPDNWQKDLDDKSKNDQSLTM